MMDRNLVWDCRLLDICFHNRRVARMIPKFTLWNGSPNIKIQAWPPVTSSNRRGRGRGRARGRGRGRARGRAHDLPADSPGGGAYVPEGFGLHEAGALCDGDAVVDGSDVDAGDACGSDVSSISDDPFADGPDESEMAEALALVEKMMEEAQIVFIRPIT